MYLAELHGKLSSRVERMEDILTSNVFSFFKYTSRKIFLKGYLDKLGFNISEREASRAEFLFWPRYEENTEPDLVIIVGDYYLLIEAKYFSDFGQETSKTKAQLIREVEGGEIDAKNYGKEFVLIAITADHYFKKEKFETIPERYKSNFIWTNWQLVSSFLNYVLEANQSLKKQEREFATDLYSLLDKKNLRDFQSYNALQNIQLSTASRSFVFLQGKKVTFRGKFIGFQSSVVFENKMKAPKEDFLFLKLKKSKYQWAFRGFKNSLLFDRKLMINGQVYSVGIEKKA